jgi:hypothetical protein
MEELHRLPKIEALRLHRRELGLCLLALLALGAAACSQVAVIHSAKSPNAAFDRYTTFGFVAGDEAPEHFEPSERSVQVDRVIREEANKALQAKGYRLVVAGAPALTLWIAAGRRERHLRRPRSAAAGPAWLDEDEDENFTEGAFVIDAFDGATQELVWHESARTQIDPNGLDEPRLRHDVDRVLSTFPPGRSAAASVQPP